VTSLIIIINLVLDFSSGGSPVDFNTKRNNFLPSIPATGAAYRRLVSYIVVTTPGSLHSDQMAC